MLHEVLVSTLTHEVLEILYVWVQKITVYKWSVRAFQIIFTRFFNFIVIIINYNFFGPLLNNTKRFMIVAEQSIKVENQYCNKLKNFKSSTKFLAVIRTQSKGWE